MLIEFSEQYKLAGREFKPDDTVVQVGPARIGSGALAVMAGPCAVESEEQLLAAARAVKESGAAILRGGAFKPRTSPYSFQGLGKKGLELLALARRETGLPVVTEAVDPESLDLVEEYADMIQIGARNMQNFSLLRRAGQAHKPVLLKRGLSATLDEFLMAAEYILAEGNRQVVLCERGVRTFADHARNTLDLGIVPAVRKLSHLPIIVDPSHGTGRRHQVPPMALAAAAAGAHGLIVEVHSDPDHALCDGPQSLSCEEFGHLMRQLGRLQDLLAGPAAAGTLVAQEASA